MLLSPQEHKEKPFLTSIYFSLPVVTHGSTTQTSSLFQVCTKKHVCASVTSEESREKVWNGKKNDDAQNIPCGHKDNEWINVIRNFFIKSDSTWPVFYLSHWFFCWCLCEKVASVSYLVSYHTRGMIIMKKWMKWWWW